MTTAAPLVIRVLGSLEVDLDGRVLAVGGPQQRRLLALLVVNRGRVVGVDRIIEALWPDSDPPDGANRSILTYVSRLRAVLPAGVLTTTDGGYRLEADRLECDIDEFDRLVTSAEASMPDGAIELLTEAIAQWRGNPFGEFGNEYWAVAESARLEERRAVAHEERATALLAIGHHARAVPSLEEMVRNHPIRERPVELLMQALRSAGRQAEAIRAFQRYRRHLADETGLEPSSALQALCDSMFDADHDDGAIIGRPLRGYTILEAIGEGAFGRVYSATQPATGRTVAIKAIRPDLADSSEFVHRFELEAQLVARLEHPHIVPLYDFWREPGGAYLVFRLLRGGTAEESLITGGRWSLDRATQLVEQVGSAMITAHAAGVVHGDLRPANILLDGDGNMFVADFGIASEHVDAHADFHAGVLADIADLAMTVWELLAGSSPARSVWRESLPSLIGRVADLPAGVDAVLGRAVSSHTGDRFESIAEFVLAWRASVGRSAVSIGVGGARPTSSDRRLAASQLNLRAASGLNPYRGLRPFAEADARDFFGREETAAALRSAVGRARFVAVVGASGLGKSSLVFAGLAPIIHEEGGMQIASMTPGEDPLAALHSALSNIALSQLNPEDLMDAVGTVAGQSTGGLLIIVDQFEECWTLVDTPRRDAFLALLAACAERSGEAPVSVVVTLRADMYDRPLADPRLGALIAAETFPLTPMRAVELEHAIALPAARAHVDFEDGIVSLMVAEALTNPASLPLLQFALRELFERRVDGMITAEAYDGLGGVAGAIAGRAEQVFGALSEADQDRSRWLFGRLVTPGHGVPDSRRRCSIGELPAATQAIAEQFVTARLLVADHDPVTREPTIELAHESLLTAWSRLGGWIDDDRRWLMQLQHLSAAARSWDQSARSADELYRGSRLEGALEELPFRRDHLTELEVDFVEEGRQARDADTERSRQRVSRLRRLLAVVAVLLVVAVVAGSIAIVQRRSAERTSRSARIGALVGAIGTVRTTRRDTAALLAIEAFRMSDTPAARSALFSTFTAAPGFLDLHRLAGSGSDIVGVVTSDRAFVRGGDNRVRPYDPETGLTGEPFELAIPARSVDELTGAPDNPAPNHVTSLVGSQDGALVAQLDGVVDSTGAATTSIALFDSRSGNTVADVVSVDTAAGTLVINPSSTGFVVSGGYDGAVTAVDIATGAETGHLTGLTPPEDLGNQLWRNAGLAYLDSDHLAVGSVADTIRIVDPVTLREIAEPIAVPPNTTATLVALADGRQLLGTGLNGVVLIDVPSRSIVWALGDRDISPGACSDVAVVAERATFYCSDSFGRLEERDLADGASLRQLDAQNGDVESVWPAKDGRELVVFSASRPVVARWRLDGTGAITRRIAAGLVPVQYSPNGASLIAARPYGTFLNDNIPGSSVVIDASSGEVSERLASLEFAFWNDDRTIAGVTPSEQGFQLAQYDRNTQRVEGLDYTFTVQLDRNVTNAGHPKAWVATPVDDDTWEIWTFARPEGTRIDPTLTVDGLINISGSPDGHRLAATTTTGVIVYDADTGAERARLDQRTDLRGIFFVSDRLLAISSLSGELALYDTDTLTKVRTLNGSRGFIEDVQASRDGDLVVVRGGDRNVQLIDVAAGTPIGGQISIPGDERRGVALRPDGLEIAVGGGTPDGIAIWDLDPAEWVAAACRVAGRNLTEDEWNTYIGTLAPYHQTC